MAEVLITLTIIGVIAALTIPNLIRKYEDHIQLAAFKKAYSTLSNAFKMAIAENGPITEWTENISLTLSKYLKVQKYCGNATCFNYGWYVGFKDVSGGHYRHNGVFPGNGGVFTGDMILDNGMAITFHSTSTQNFSDIGLFVDTNGIKKGPNRMGYDVFVFGYDKNGLNKTSGVAAGSAASYCNPTVGRGDRDGNSCAYWILRHNNMDYKYRDVSAEW